MATLVLGAVGFAIGSSFDGAFLGLSGTVIGGMIGSTIGSAVDSWLISSLAPAQRIEGARLDSLRIAASTEGAVIPRVYGRMRIGGNIIWATDFREEVTTTTQGGGKGGGPKVKTTEYLYYASFAVALCERVVAFFEEGHSHRSAAARFRVSGTTHYPRHFASLLLQCLFQKTRTGHWDTAVTLCDTEPSRYPSTEPRPRDESTIRSTSFSVA